MQPEATPSIQSESGDPGAPVSASAGAPRGKTAGKLAGRLILFGLPYALLLGFPAWYMREAGELRKVDEVIREQAGGADGILGLAYTNPDKYFKLKGTAERKPGFLVLGASRIMQIRKEFFREDLGFYNAGGGVERIRHLRIFLAGIPEGAEPKHILLGLEQCFFNPAWDNLAPDAVAGQYAATVAPIQILTGSFTTFYGDLLSGKISLRRIREARAGGGRIGLNAVMNENGFRKDGSYHAGSHLNDPDNPKHPDHDFKATMARIAAGNERFEPSAAVNPAAVAELEAFLAECARRNIHVTGFLPPFAPTVHAKLASLGDRYKYLFDLGGALAPGFAARGFVFRDFSNMAPLGATDMEFFDGFHGSEKVMLRLLAPLAEADTALAAFADPARLRSLLEAAKDSRYRVF